MYVLSLCAALVCALDDGQPAHRDDRPQALTLAQSTPAAEASARAIAAGLDFLARAQAQSGDGSFAVTDVESSNYAPLGISALCALAFMAAGNAPGRGPHGAVVTRAIDYLLLHTDLAPESKQRGYISAQGDAISRTHGHGYATLALAEAYGMSSGSERIRNALLAAVERIEHSQGAEGGWFYSPTTTADHEGSVTICLVQALRAARDAGVQVDGEVIRRAEDYVRRLQNKNGLFCYTLGAREHESLALTAAAVSTLNATGTYDDHVIHDAVDALWSGLAVRDRPAEFPEYERLYMAQAFWQLADESYFQRWFEDERVRLLRTQESDGGWKGARFGACYATAVNCLVLSIPDSLLPIFQR